MSLGAALFSYLSTNPQLVSLVGTRIFPYVGVQAGARPYVTYQVIDTESEHSHGGPSHLGTTRVQFDAWAETYVQAWDITKAIKSALDGFTGDLGDYQIQASFHDNDLDQYESDPKLYRVTQDFRMWVREAVTGS